jgi:2',3'-cyclic-nucleotide 2'-phosphodiesterase
MRLLFIGDIVARPGRDLVRRHVGALARHHAVDLVIANAENAAAGAGITRDLANEFFRDGVHVLTSGNHIWDKREVLEYIATEPRLLRPANYPAAAPGHGSFVARTATGVAVGVINIMGRVFLPSTDDPFAVVRREIAIIQEAGARIIFVDFHAETSSEKIAMGWYLDGEVTALVGTHTHVQTADARILPKGTAYLTDVGMTGPHDGVIGMEREAVIQRFTTGVPVRFEPATGDPRLHAVLIDADETSGHATAIQTLSLTAEELDAIVTDVSRREPVNSR